MPNNTETPPRIYVACLASYNGGKLHGAWIDANQPPEDIQSDIDDMLAASPCPPAEDYAIHDSEGFGSIEISAHESLERVSVIAEVLSDRGAEAEVVAVALDQCDRDTDPAADDLREWIEEHYAGTYRTVEEWAEEYLEDTGHFASVPDEIKQYFDFESWARDAELGGDIFTVEGGRGVLIFWSR